jgi:hypothetical protein
LRSFPGGCTWQRQRLVGRGENIEVASAHHGIDRLPIAGGGVPAGIRSHLCQAGGVGEQAGESRSQRLGTVLPDQQAGFTMHNPSRGPGTSKVTAGSPEAIASSSTLPKVSLSDGKTNRSAEA